MTGPEKKFKQQLKRNLVGVDFNPLESALSAGFPDVNCCYKGREFWMELKAERMHLRPSQAAWIMRRIKHGGVVWIVMRTKDGQVWLWWGGRAGDLANNERRHWPDKVFPELDEWGERLAKIDWEKFLEIVSTHPNPDMLK